VFQIGDDSVFVAPVNTRTAQVQAGEMVFNFIDTAAVKQPKKTLTKNRTFERQIRGNSFSSVRIRLRLA